MPANNANPHLRKHEYGTQLVVNDEPFLVLGGQLQNSSLSSARYMQEIWPKLKAAHINTVLGPVTWQMIEPEEGRFDFEELNKILVDARRHDLHLILLWFGSYKNGVSTYVPDWVKQNPSRFPRMVRRQDKGRSSITEVISMFSEEACDADMRAFSTLMQHIKTQDEQHSTVIMVQVQNEIGLLGDSRDGSSLANQRFHGNVPPDLISVLQRDFDHLTDHLKANLSFFWANNSYLNSGTWEEVFGSSIYTDQLFMAYHYAQYVEKVAAAGKAIYPLPLYTNAWQSCTPDERDSNSAFPLKWVNVVTNPGEFPSGGPNIQVLDIWQRFCPSLDLYAPDLYLNDYETSQKQFSHGNQPIFISEQRRDQYAARRAWKLFGTYRGIGTAPFGIDTVETQFGFNPFKTMYMILQSVSRLVLEAQTRPATMAGFYFDDPDVLGSMHDHEKITLSLGPFEFTVKRSFVFGKPGPGGGIIIWLEGTKYLFLGFGYMASFKARDPKVSHSAS